MSYITVYTDASHCHRTGCAGVAVWARNDTESLKKSSGFSDIEQSNDAEILAISWGVCQVLDNLQHNKTDNVVIVSDCIHAIHHMIGRDVKSTAFAIECRNMLHSRLDGMIWWMKHVKAHTGNSDKRSKLNRWCDNQARYEMNKIRGNYVKRPVYR